MLKLPGLVLVLLKSWAQGPSIGWLSCLQHCSPWCGPKNREEERVGGRAREEDDLEVAHIYSAPTALCRIRSRCHSLQEMLVLCSLSDSTEDRIGGNRSNQTQPFSDLVICS